MNINGKISAIRSGGVSTIAGGCGALVMDSTYMKELRVSISQYKFERRHGQTSYATRTILANRSSSSTSTIHQKTNTA